ncbi:hypothetical protein UlMin_035305 [Ulmus minor]
MDIYILFLLLLLPLVRATDTLAKGSSLSVEKPSHVLVSSNGVFSAGFVPVGVNAYGFSVRFMKSSALTIIWMANRDQPVNGKGSKLLLTKNGNLVLLDAGRVSLWSTKTDSISPVKLHLRDNGNLVLITSENVVLWESFKSPTDTLLPQQRLTNEVNLISSKSQTNYSSGYYKLFFDTDNVLRLLFQGPDPHVSSVYWPYPWIPIFQNGRNTYNNSKTAQLDSLGRFSSSDELVFSTSDYGTELYRRLTLDPDGNLRVYSFDEKNKIWVVTWQAITYPCRVHGTCGPNSFCSFHHDLGSRCACLSGFQMKRYQDWFYGCEPGFPTDEKEESRFLLEESAEFYGYDSAFLQNVTLKECEEKCLNMSSCKGFQYKFDEEKGIHLCYPKAVLVNGLQAAGFNGDVYIRVPATSLSSNEKSQKDTNSNCSVKPMQLSLNRTYEKPRQNQSLKVLLWVASGLGGVEFIFISIVLCFLFWNIKENDNIKARGYMLAATKFQEFTYSELRKATRGFREEIGRGSGGIVYKGVLPDNRVAAIKRLGEANLRGEGEFLAEVSTIGRLNHMNLIEMWGYCAEGKHRLLVYEFLEHGSLADNLSSNALDWDKRFAIAVGTAKGLAYLHEECLEWVLHCDVKPQNILLDSKYQPKVADFGLSKLFNRDEVNNSNFSKIRGTRGYMAPEWVYNLPITSKVDVYSYGIVALEIVTGKKPTSVQVFDGGRTAEDGRLVTWVREKMNGTRESWIEEITDPVLEGKFDKAKTELLVKVALQCVEEDKEARPDMRQVVEMLEEERSL